MIVRLWDGQHTIDNYTMETPGERNLRVKKLLELFENDQVKHQEKAVIAVLGETFEDVFGPKWWCQATR